MSFETDFHNHISTVLGSAVPVRYGYAESVRRPFVVLTVEDSAHYKTTEGVSSVYSIEFLIECFEKKPSSARDLAAQVVAAYQDFTGVIGSYKIDFSRVYGQSDANDSGGEDFLRSFSLVFTYKATS